MVKPAPPKADAIHTDIKCGKVNDYFVLRDGAAGLFLAASQFPKNRETRTPSIAELKIGRLTV
jgi:DNA topoisomerase-1